MIDIHTLEQQLGLMCWPLVICSLLTLALLLERFLYVLFSGAISRNPLSSLKRPSAQWSQDELCNTAEQLSAQRSLQKQGIGQLMNNHHLDKTLREECAAIWLQTRRRKLNAGLRLLALLGVVSPLLGLLGTVLGLIEMFQAIAHTQDPVTPSLLADGLGIAMRTTAAGLLIAVPAIVGSQLIGLWAERIVAGLEHTLNHCNLWLEGVPLNQESHG
ncbi:MotA/TolQ/ExbB proton channel family protein [Dongshaea marina]|uniref:MotA/TolQ/ExbB proton channel family protein n=1 Tax=Dongshaea marina TaxID=2047966 RepID=UPI000D3E7431|nr:MotA/TolQ/ExbB proton channel family protein [Dongshaea marina]